MPSMVISEKDKTQDWCRQVLNAVTSYMGAEGGAYHTARTKDIRNYQIYNGQLNQADYNYINQADGISLKDGKIQGGVLSGKNQHDL